MSHNPEGISGSEKSDEPPTLVGYIIKAKGETFVTRLVIRGGKGSEYEAEFDKSTIPPEDLDRIQLGVVIELKPEPKSEPIEPGSPPFGYRVTFRDLQPLTQAEIDKAMREAEAMREVFGLDESIES